MAYNFGLTWWGSEWLRALDRIDYSNRLPRGRSYARNDMVRDVTIKGNVIQAKVSGSRRIPYNVTIVVPEFEKKVVDKFVSELLKHPAIVARLLNRELSPQVLEIAGEVGMQIFPSRWRDLKMHCSCPDWAVPCKHLAAVIYMVSREIDNNPFLVFEMHNIDLPAELKRRGVEIEQERTMDVPETATLLEELKTEDVKAKISPRVVDYSHLTDITTSLASLLAPQPAFYQDGDFRAFYERVLKRVSKLCRNYFKGKHTGEVFPTEGKLWSIDHYTDIKVELSPALQATYSSRSTGKREKAIQATSVTTFALALDNIKPEFLADYQPGVALLKQAMMCALHLLANGAVVPRIVQYKGAHTVLWFPATLHARVKKVLDDFEAIMPAGLVTAAFGRRKGNVKNSGLLLLSRFLTDFIAWTGRREGIYSPVGKIFFCGEWEKFNAVGESETPGGIKSWLDRFDIATDDTPLVFVVDETAKCLAMSVKVMNDVTDESSALIDLKDIMASKSMKNKQFVFFKKLAALVSLIPGLEEYINSLGNTPMLFTLSEFTPVLLESIPALQMLGMKVVLPRGLRHLVRPQASIKLSAGSPASKSPSAMRLDKLLKFDWQIALGETIVSVEEFLEFMKGAEGLLKFKGQYIYVDSGDLERLNKSLNARSQLNSAQLLQAALSESLGSVPITMTEEVRTLLSKLTTLPELPVPTGLNAQLRPYQERGYSWMYHNMRLGFGSIIADDMGLGKTLQVISLILQLKNENRLKKHHVLIVVPTGLLTNWVAEFARFAPAVTTHVYHGTGRDIAAFSHDVMLTSYGVMRSDQEQLKKLKWALLVIDEAQNIKNSSTAQSKAVKGIKADCRIAMSGTPVENRLNEFWSIMDFANKGYMGNERSFVQDFANPIQQSGDRNRAELFRKITAPFMLRRLKTDKSIITDLPDKIEQDDMAVLTPRQASLYKQTLNTAMEVIAGIDDTDKSQLFERQGLVLQMIMALKQICNHPSQFLKDGGSDPALSGKATMLLDLLQSIVDSGDKVLIFTQFREMGDLLQRFVEDSMGMKPLFYHGGCSIKQRNEIVDRFQNNRADRILILSIKAAGTGLNLTAATHVIHYDLWWNPAVEAQATDRAYRIGQHRNVIVHRFITQGTFEERINEMIQRKKELANLTVSTGENWIGKLSNAELREIFAFAQ